MTRPTFLSSGDIIADRRFEWARDREAKGDLAGAADLLVQALELAPAYASAWFALGEMREKLGDRAGAVAAFKQAEKDATVKAIVLRVDSPGGSALASDVMWRQITQCKKPVICSMGDVTASGGYYIAMPCKKIYAEPGTITGSIGVFGMKLVTGDLEKWAGLKTEVIARGKNTGVNSTSFPWSESERQTMEEYIENGAQLGWLIDPIQKKVYVYRPDAEVEELDNPDSISGDPLLKGFVLDLKNYFG